MKIVWEEAKRQRNLVKHKLDFADLDLEFFAASIVTPARQGRAMAIGEYRGVVVVAVVFAPLGTEGLSVISMRMASMRERRMLWIANSRRNDH